MCRPQSTDPYIFNLTKHGSPEAKFVNSIREVILHSRADVLAERLTSILTKTERAGPGNSLDAPARPRDESIS